MKAINFCCVLLLICIAEVAYSETSQNKIQQELLDALTTDESLKVKRPFCNAFTGCGKKRSFRESSAGQEPVANGIRLPLPVYKALLRAASQNIRGAIDRESSEYRLPGIPQVYLPRMTLRKRLDVPSTSLN